MLLTKINIILPEELQKCQRRTGKRKLMDSLPFCLKSRVQLGDHDLGPLLDSLKTPTDYVLAGEKSFSFFFKYVMTLCCNCH